MTSDDVAERMRKLLRARLLFLSGFLILGMASAQWGPIIRLTYTDTKSYPQGIVVAGSYVHVIWSDEYAPGQRGELYARSSDGGNHWSSPVLLDSSDEGCQILTSGDSIVHLFMWTSPGPLDHRRSTDNGSTWSFRTRIADSMGHARAAVNLDTCLHVVAMRNDSLFLVNSLDNGAHWDSARYIVSGHEMSLHYEHLAADDSSRLHVCWADYYHGSFVDGFYIRSTDNGASWQPKVSIGTVVFAASVVASNQNNVYLFAVDEYRLPFVVRSSDGGATWYSKSETWYWGDVCSDNGWLHGAITKADISGKREIKYARSWDSARTWDVFDVSSVDSMNSTGAGLAVSESLVHFVWSDSAPGNYEVFYRKGSLFMPGVQEDLEPSAEDRLVPYPQPARTVLYLLRRAQPELKDLRVYDASGRRMQNVTWQHRAGTVSVTLSTLRTGVYSAVLLGAPREMSFRFVVCK